MFWGEFWRREGVGEEGGRDVDIRGGEKTVTDVGWGEALGKAGTVAGKYRNWDPIEQSQIVGPLGSAEDTLSVTYRGNGAWTRRE